MVRWAPPLTLPWRNPALHWCSSRYKAWRYALVVQIVALCTLHWCSAKSKASLPQWGATRRRPMGKLVALSALLLMATVVDGKAGATVAASASGGGGGAGETIVLPLG